MRLLGLSTAYVCISWVIGLVTHHAVAGPLLIPVRSNSVPALDLVDQKGTPLDLSDATALSKTTDLSLLDPLPSDAWSNQKWTHESLGIDEFPRSDQFVLADGNPNQSSGNVFQLIQFETSNGSIKSHRLILSMNLHASLARAELLRKLGYPIPLLKHYPTLKVQFKDQASLGLLLKMISQETATDPKIWIEKQSDPTDATVWVELKDVALESPQLIVPAFHWGVIGPKDIQGARAVLALPIALSFLEIPESINIFSWDAARVLNENILIDVPSAAAFQADPSVQYNVTSYFDAKWMVRRLAKLNDQDFNDIVSAGHFPKDVAYLLKQKLLARRNSLIQVFELENDLESAQYPKLKPLSKNKINFGSVKKGRLTTSNFPGYPMRFSFDPVPSPLRFSQISRFLQIEAIGQGLGAALDWVSQKFLTAQSVNQVIQKRQNELIQSIQNHFQQNPNLPFEQEVESFGGVIGGLNVSTGRSIVSGAYFGSDSPVQMVDRIGVSASLGYFAGIDGIPKVIPGIQGNVSVSRNYVHVKPLGNLKEAVKAKLTDLFIPGVLFQMGQQLNDPSMKWIFEELRENEILIITDSLNYGIGAQVQIPLQLALSVLPPSFSPSVGLSGTFAPQIFNRTTIIRTKDGIQVYAQNAKLKNIDFEASLKWYVNLVMAGVQGRSGQAESKAILLDQAAITQLSTQDHERLKGGLSALFKYNQGEPLFSAFPHFEFKHDLNLVASKFQFLIWKSRNTFEKHRFSATPPSGRGTRNFFSLRNTKIRGSSPWGFLGEWIGSASKGRIKLGNQSGIDPASEFFGQSFKTQVRTEVEVTSKAADSLSLLEETHSGWSISRKKVIKILSRIEESVKSLTLDKGIFRKEIFNNTKHVQLYQIQSSLTLYSGAITKIENTILESKDPIELKESLMKLTDPTEYERNCQDFDPNFNYIVREKKKSFDLGCIEPWMRKVFEFRSRRLELPPSSESLVEDRHRLVRGLFESMNRSRFLNWIGKENLFFQGKVTGFRTTDENEDPEIYTDTIGNQNRPGGLGPFRDLIERYDLNASEIMGQYLSEGY